MSKNEDTVLIPAPAPEAPANDPATPTTVEQPKVDPMAAFAGFVVIDDLPKTARGAGPNGQSKYAFETYPAPFKQMSEDGQTIIKTHYASKVIALGADLQAATVRGAIKKFYDRLKKAGTKPADLPNFVTTTQKDKDGKEVSITVVRQS